MAGAANDQGQLNFMIGAPVGQHNGYRLGRADQRRVRLQEQAMCFNWALDALQRLAMHALINRRVQGIQFNMQAVIGRRAHDFAGRRDWAV